MSCDPLPSMAHACRLRINDGVVTLPLTLFSPTRGSVTRSDIPFPPGSWGWCQHHLTCCPGLFSSGPDPSLSAGAVNTADARVGGGGRQGVRQQEATTLWHCDTVIPSCPCPSPPLTIVARALLRAPDAAFPILSQLFPLTLGTEREGFSPWTLLLRDRCPRGSPLVPTIPGSVWGTQRCC